MTRVHLCHAFLTSLFLGGWLVLSSGSADQPEDKLTGDLRRAWELLNTGQHEAAIHFVDGALGSFATEAAKEAGKMNGFASAGHLYDSHRVNIAGTLNYVRALAFQRSGKRDEWLTALRRVWSDFPFCQAWDPRGWWWKPAEAAKKEGYQEILRKAVQDRELTKSPFPEREDALDSPQMTIALAVVVRQFLETDDYEALEYLAGRLGEIPVRLPDGNWALPFFFAACAEQAGPEKEEASWERARDRMAAWQKACPQSAAAPVAAAVQLIHHAWHVRGSGYAESVKPEAWPVFETRIQAAKAALEKSSRACPEWYVARLTVSRAQGEPREREVAVFDEGWKAHPGYTPLLNEMVTDLLPRWGGQPGDWHRMAKRVAKGSDARTYALMVNAGWTYENAGILKVSGFDRALYRKGWKELLSDHPESLSLAHQCLRIALSVDDKELTSEALHRTGQRYHPGFWRNPEEFLLARSAAGEEVN